MPRRILILVVGCMMIAGCHAKFRALGRCRMHAHVLHPFNPAPLIQDCMQANGYRVDASAAGCSQDLAEESCYVRN